MTAILGNLLSLETRCLPDSLAASVDKEAHRLLGPPCCSVRELESAPKPHRARASRMLPDGDRAGLFACCALRTPSGRAPASQSAVFDFDFVIATHNRSALLACTLASFAGIRCPPGRTFRVTVVANACSDDTSAAVARLVDDSPFPPRYLEQPIAGKSCALNMGVAACDAEWIAFVDDDERIAPDWLEVFDEARERLGFDFAGGRYIAEYEAAPPDWLPARHLAPVIACHPGDVSEGRVEQAQNLVWGGNFIVRREALQRTGEFDVEFARHPTLMALGCEDADMVQRLLAVGYVGWFLPGMQIQHWTPQDRLTRTYFRRKIYGHGYTGRRYEQSRRAAMRRQVMWLGLPRWRWRAVMQGVVGYCAATLRGARPDAFGHELDLWWIAGYLKAAGEED